MHELEQLLGEGGLVAVEHEVLARQRLADHWTNPRRAEKGQHVGTAGERTVTTLDTHSEAPRGEIHGERRNLESPTAVCCFRPQRWTGRSYKRVCNSIALAIVELHHFQGQQTSASSVPFCAAAAAAVFGRLQEKTLTVGNQQKK